MCNTIPSESETGFLEIKEYENLTMTHRQDSCSHIAQFEQYLQNTFHLERESRNLGHSQRKNYTVQWCASMLRVWQSTSEIPSVGNHLVFSRREKDQGHCSISTLFSNPPSIREHRKGGVEVFKKRRLSTEKIILVWTVILHPLPSALRSSFFRKFGRVDSNS